MHSQLKFKNKNNANVLQLTEEQWELVANVELNVFLDDGEGYIDLGLDNAISFDDDGDMLADYDKTWLALNGQVVSYYFISETSEDDSYVIRGRVPAMLNGELVNLILEFTDENPTGTVLGAQTDYDGLNDVQAKGYTALQDGDTLDFLCDYYDYEGNYQDDYYLGDQMTVNGELQISNVSVGNEPFKASYRITDMYHNTHWTETIE